MNVSIIITAYNRPKQLVEAVKSCIAQTYAPFEIIIGDDSQSEESVMAVKPLLNSTNIKIRHIHNKPSLRQANNMNMLFDEAKGEKTLLLHDDDLLLPEALATLCKVFSDQPHVEIAYGKQYIIDDNGIINKHASLTYNRDYFREKQYEGTVLTSLEAGMGQQLPNNGFMLNTSIIKNLKWRNDLGNGGEYEYGYRLGLQGYKMYYIDKYLSMYRVSKSSMMYTKKEDSALQAFLILEKAAPESAFGKDIRLRRLTERAPIAITQAINNHKKREAVRIMFGPWYRKRVLSPRGVKRILQLMNVIG